MRTCQRPEKSDKIMASHRKLLGKLWEGGGFTAAWRQASPVAGQPSSCRAVPADSEAVAHSTWCPGALGSTARAFAERMMMQRLWSNSVRAWLCCMPNLSAETRARCLKDLKLSGPQPPLHSATRGRNVIPCWLQSASVSRKLRLRASYALAAAPAERAA